MFAVPSRWDSGCRSRWWCRFLHSQHLVGETKTEDGQMDRWRPVGVDKDEKLVSPCVCECICVFIPGDATPPETTPQQGHRPSPAADAPPLLHPASLVPANQYPPRSQQSRCHSVALCHRHLTGSRAAVPSESQPTCEEREVAGAIFTLPPRATHPQ